MYILGINAFHADSSACIFKEDKLIGAIEEERIRRIKHWAGFPVEAVKYCLSEAKIGLEQVDYIAIGRDPKANFFKKIQFVICNQVKIGSVINRLVNSKEVSGLKSIISSELGVPESVMKAKFYNIEHHRSHLASAYFASPFEKAALLSVDGFGDFTSTMTAMGEKNKIHVIDSVIYPHSIGIFYTAFTQFLGFPKYGDEYKVMGLAPYGKPQYINKLKEIIHFTNDGLFRLNKKFFRHVKEGVEMNWQGGEPHIGPIFNDYFIRMFGPPRKKEEVLSQHHKDLAASVQKVTEEVIFHILNHLYRKTKVDTLCLAGGVAQNSVANGKIYSNTPFKMVYIPPAGHDAGICIGSALYLRNHILNKPKIFFMKTASTGSSYNNEEIEKILRQKNILFEKNNEEELLGKVTDCIIGGGVVGWFQGKAEFGPRALGHRSILVDPRRSDAKAILNLKIKRRESFRPFAPSILKEFVSEYFECSADVPFMEKVFVIKEEKRKLIPAVTHVDGTSRLQTVDSSAEPKYHALISAFYKKTRVPILLNTSFNENEPIVNHPMQALDCFLRTKMDMLVIENYIVKRL